MNKPARTEVAPVGTRVPVPGLVILLTFLCSAAAAVAEEPGPDNPLVSRFEGASMHAYQHSGYDEVSLPSAPIPGDAYHGRRGWITETLEHVVLPLEGRVTWISYQAPEGRSTLEIVRNYEGALVGDGFDVLFSCAQQAGCGAGIGRYVNNVLYPDGYWPRRSGFVRPGFVVRGNTRALLAGREDNNGTAHVFLYLSDEQSPPIIHQVVVEGEPMPTGQVHTGVRSADELQTALVAEGRAIVEGIFFETDSADIRPESADALEQMARLLLEHPDIEVLVVGHTDNQGSFDYNTDLSLRRAAAVRAALASEYGVAGARMSARGASFMAPIASNAADEGRALNRRVELVLR